MSKHTPGPWMAYWEYEGGPLLVGAGTNCSVASMFHPPGGGQLENARLIAAAPDLLSALNAMLTHMGMDEDEWNKPTFDQARAAIAKATGSAQ